MNESRGFLCSAESKNVHTCEGESHQAHMSDICLMIERLLLCAEMDGASYQPPAL